MHSENGARAAIAATTDSRDLYHLVRSAISLGAAGVPGWSAAERELAAMAETVTAETVTAGSPLPSEAALREQIQAGADPLGDAFCRIRPARQRRPLGQTYTPGPVVAAMIAWAAGQGTPHRVIDPGVGSARYLVAAARRWPHAQLLGVDIDPVAAVLARGHLAAAGLSGRATVCLRDYRELRPPRIEGTTLYLGNPPYVRHHQIEPAWKQWLVSRAAERNIPATALAGLHAHFFLATAIAAQPGDTGTFVTSAEWLDVNYGRLVRELLLDELGGQAVHILDPTIEVFPDAVTTAAITCFRIGDKPAEVRLRQVKRVADLGALGGGRPVARAELAQATRWTPLVHRTPKLPTGYVELGDLCRVHRGQVTGGNATWVVARGATALPRRLLFPSVTRARELFAAQDRLTDDGPLRLVIDLPADLDELAEDDRPVVADFLTRARANGAADGYIARARRAWWRVGLHAPAPILATYMARRPPAFVRNEVAARHINIAHGLYPREDIPPATLDRLARYLRTSVAVHQGRTYAGGLTKFEPREMERLPVPTLETLRHDPLP
jgi:adenine-specific DNA-methyltransferase